MLHQTVLRIRIIILDADPYQMKQIRNTATSSKQDPDPFSILMCDCVSELGKHKNPPKLSIAQEPDLAIFTIYNYYFLLPYAEKKQKKIMAPALEGQPLSPLVPVCADMCLSIERKQRKNSPLSCSYHPEKHPLYRYLSPSPSN